VFNGNDQTVQMARLYEGGRYWLGAGYKFVQFPRMQRGYVWSSTYKSSRKFFDDITVNTNSMNIRTSDGLRISIDLAIHYKVGLSLTNNSALIQEFAEIYKNLGQTGYSSGDSSSSWDAVIDKVTKASVNSACANYTTSDFFQNRDGIVNAMQRVIKANLAKMGFTLITTNLMNVNIPNSLTAALI
jgi:uncharacterized membrane protein YqiK